MRRPPTWLAPLIGSVVAWIAASALYLLIRFGGTKDTMDWATGPGALVGMGLVAGCLLGTTDWALNRLTSRPGLRARPFSQLIALKMGMFLVATLLIVLLSRLLAVAQGRVAAADIVPSFLERLTAPTTLVVLIYIGAVAFVYTLGRHMTNMIGQRVLVNLMLGRYHRPKTEERIFMFLDLKASTTHAERLGHEKFCRLIQDCFRDLTDSAIRHEVEIYQYVGDEAILTWRIPEGRRNWNCIHVFFQFCDELGRRAAYYEENYGVVPEFKAGVNVGPVTVAEVGVLKRDIAYLSDVLNTAARLQGECAKYDAELLASRTLLDLLPPSPPFRVESVGHLSLRGREEEVDVCAVSRG